jgi:hypothetical protein
MTPTQLTALAEKVEGAEGADRGLDAAIADAIGWWPDGYTRHDVHGPDRRWTPSGAAVPHRVDCSEWTASLDAALTLVPEGWHTRMATQDRHSGRWQWVLRGSFGVECAARAATPALALTAAALRAQAALSSNKSENEHG